MVIVRHERIYDMGTRSCHAVRIWALASCCCTKQEVEGTIFIPECEICGDVILKDDTTVGEIVFRALMCIRSITVSNIVVCRERMMSPSRGLLGQILPKPNEVALRMIMIGDGRKLGTKCLTAFMSTMLKKKNIPVLRCSTLHGSPCMWQPAELRSGSVRRGSHVSDPKEGVCRKGRVQD